MANFPSQYNFFVLHDNNDPLIIEVLNSHAKFTLVTTKDYRGSKFIMFIFKIRRAYAILMNKLFKVNYQTNYFDSINRMVRQLCIDIIHCPYQYVPPVENVKLICTMHDVQELHFPLFFTPEERARRAVNYCNYINRADSIVVSYEHIKEDIVNFFHKEESAVNVVLLKMDNLWFRKYISSSVIKRNIHFNEYLLYPANSWLHKNHKKLIQAIMLLKAKNICVNLIFTGDFDNTNGQYIKQLIFENNLNKQIKILGIVDEHDLFSLYKNALGVIIPTLYEAGSFPLMESILIGIPVICSSVTSLPETIGSSDFIFNPNNIYSMSEKIESLWTDELFRELSIANNKNQVKRLIETNADSKLQCIYDGLISKLSDE